MQSRCPHCGTKRSHKGDHTVTLRTLFGKLRFKSPRVYHCQCQPHPTRTFSHLAELLPERMTMMDRAVQQRARAFHIGHAPPAVAHLVSAYAAPGPP